jgi:hypothetical protein
MKTSTGGERERREERGESEREREKVNMYIHTQKIE